MPRFSYFSRNEMRKIQWHIVQEESINVNVCNRAGSGLRKVRRALPHQKCVKLNKKRELKDMKTG